MASVMGSPLAYFDADAAARMASAGRPIVGMGGVSIRMTTFWTQFRQRL